MIFGGAVKLPAPRRTSEVLVHPPAAPGVPPLPGVTGLALALARRAAGPGTHGVQQAEQQQQRDRQHCGMVRAGRLWRKNRRLPSSPPGPIQKDRGAPKCWRAPVPAARARIQHRKAQLLTARRTGTPPPPTNTRTLLSPLKPESSSPLRGQLLLWSGLRASPQTERRYKRSLWRQ